MAQVINTNIMSLVAQQNLNMSQSSLQTSMTRLSSGLRINSAADDAAGLAISDSMTSQINGMNQAQRNANDAISLAQTAGGSLTSITNSLQSIRQLAVQSANATNNQTDRNDLQTQVSQLLSEIDRVAGSTNFNGVKLLDGSSPSFTFQVGAGTTNNDTIQVSGLPNATLAGLGSVTSASTQSGAITGMGTGALAAGSITINGTDIGALTAVGTSTERANQLVSAINQVSTTTGVNAYIDSTSNKVVLSSQSSITVAGTDNGTVSTLANGTTAAATTTGLTSLNVSSFAGAQLAINQVDSALSQIDTAQATIGAVQNRFSSVVANLTTTSTNTSASRSRIQDADFAAETANMTRSQILQQAGTAMLAQANSLPNNVLTLLKG